MMNLRNAIVFLLAIEIIATSGSFKSAEADEPKVEVDLTALEQRTEKLANERDVLGPQLVAVLSNDKAPNHERIHAARLLAKLQYQPAIPVLIRHAHLRPSKYSEASDPIAGALGQFGAAAVPSIIQAYLSHESENEAPWEFDSTEYTLVSAIYDPPTEEVARTYIQGIALGDLAEKEGVDLRRTIKIHTILEYLSLK